MKRDESGPVLYTSRFVVMGGPASVQLVTSQGQDFARELVRQAEAEAFRIESKYSRYLESSVVSTINRMAGRTPVAVDEETLHLIAAALEMVRLSSGRFDPTIGPLRQAWDFRGKRVPSREEIARLAPLVDSSAVSARDGTVFLRRSGMELDLGGVGKEFAVDLVAQGLRKEGIASAIVNFAGDVRTVGFRGDGRPWKIGVVDPQDRRRCRFSIRAPGDVGVATSGIYERAFLEDGVLYHHILDATTGWPARGITSTTVVAPNAFRAGQLSTVALLLGAEDGLKLLEDTPGVEGVLMTEEGTLLATKGMRFVSDLPGSVWASWT